MNKFFLFFSVVSVFLVSCNKEDDRFTERLNQEIKVAGDGKYDLLGYGYDMKGEYASANSAKAPVIDINKLASLEVNRVQDAIIAFQSEQYVSGENASAYSKNLSKKFEAGIGFSLKYFSLEGNLTKDFKDETFSSNKYSYASYDRFIQRRRLSLIVDNEIIKDKYLSDNFLIDIKRLSAQAIVSKYGTHVLTDIILGGRLHALYRAEFTEKTSNKSQAAQKGIGIKLFGLKINMSSGKPGFSESEKIVNGSESFYLRTIGGDPSKGGQFNSESSIKINVDTWMASVSLQNSHLIDIADDGLIPIYRLINDSSKAEAVKNEIQKSNYISVYYDENGSSKNENFSVGDFFTGWYPHDIYMLTSSGLVRVMNGSDYTSKKFDSNILKSSEVLNYLTKVYLKIPGIDNERQLCVQDWNNARFVKNLEDGFSYVISVENGHKKALQIYEDEIDKFNLDISKRETINNLKGYKII